MGHHIVHSMCGKTKVLNWTHPLGFPRKTHCATDHSKLDLFVV